MRIRSGNRSGPHLIATRPARETWLDYTSSGVIVLLPKMLAGVLAVRV